VARFLLAEPGQSKLPVEVGRPGGAAWVTLTDSRAVRGLKVFRSLAVGAPPGWSMLVGDDATRAGLEQAARSASRIVLALPGFACSRAEVPYLTAPRRLVSPCPFGFAILREDVVGGISPRALSAFGCAGESEPAPLDGRNPSLPSARDLSRIEFGPDTLVALADPPQMPAPVRSALVGALCEAGAAGVLYPAWPVEDADILLAPELDADPAPALRALTRERARSAGPCEGYAWVLVKPLEARFLPGHVELPPEPR
jgi:hypothetical protein